MSSFKCIAHLNVLFVKKGGFQLPDPTPPPPASAIGCGVDIYFSKTMAMFKLTLVPFEQYEF